MINKQKQIDTLKTRLEMCLAWYNELATYGEKNGLNTVSFLDFEENGRPSFILTELAEKLRKSEKTLLKFLPTSQWLKEYLEASANEVPEYSEGAKESLKNTRPVMDFIHACISRMRVHTHNYSEGQMNIYTAKNTAKFIQKTLEKIAEIQL